MKRFLENDLKILTTPLLVVGLILILSFVSSKIIIDNISTLNGRLSDDRLTENKLQTKLNSLKTVNSEIGNSSLALIDALPGTNSVLTTVDELQAESLPIGLSLRNLRSSNLLMASENSIATTEIDFDADGAYESIATLIKILKDIAPITRFDSIRINNQNSANSNIYRMSATLIAYSAPLPTKIPTIEEPLLNLSSNEEAILKKVSNLKQPSFLPSLFTTNSSTANTTGVGRSDPFNN